MKVLSARLIGLRCFEDTGEIQFHPKCNIFVGPNNSGKSSMLKAVLALQGLGFDSNDIRPGSDRSYMHVLVEGVDPLTPKHISLPSDQSSIRFDILFAGQHPSFSCDVYNQSIGVGQAIFVVERPNHVLVPLLSKRKTAGFSQDVSSGRQSANDGTLSALYARIDLLATSGHPKHEKFKEAVQDIIGIPITTKAAPGGKDAGYYFNEDTFVPLDRMGEGVSELMALIVELCLEKDRIFVLEEPETNLHPKALKSLMNLVKESASTNQFMIATHSNIVVRELGTPDMGQIFQVRRTSDNATAPSTIEILEHNTASHVALLRDLGYEFVDVNLYEGWLFLEESSAESVIRDILIPFFVPALKGRLQTYSASGVTNLEPSLSDFCRLVVFVHLQPVYEGRLWVRADHDDRGIEVIDQLLRKFTSFPDGAIATFDESQFELYYPSKFASEIREALSEPDRQKRSRAKMALLQTVLNWTKADPESASIEWAKSAAPVVAFLREIETTLNNQ